MYWHTVHTHWHLVRELLYRIEWPKRGRLRIGILCVSCYILGLSRLRVCGTRGVGLTILYGVGGFVGILIIFSRLPICVWFDIFLDIGSDDVLISAVSYDIFPIAFSCELLTWDGFKNFSWWCWFFSTNAEDPKMCPVSSWKCMIPWAVIFWLRDVWHVVIFTVLYVDANIKASWWKVTITSKISYLIKGWYERSFLIFGRVEVFVPIISSNPGDQPFPNLLLCSSKILDEHYLSLYVCGSHNFIVVLIFL